MKKLSASRDILLSVLVPIGSLLLLYMFVPFSYAVNDDLTIISILNGAYTGTPDAHAIHIGYLLSLFISLLYRTGIEISWYQLTMSAILSFAVGSILYRLLKRMPKHPVLCCSMVIGGYWFLWGYQLVCFTYSTCGAFVAAMTVLCYAVQPKESDLQPGNLASILLLYFLSFSIRKQFLYISTLLLGIVWLIKYAKELGKNRRCWLIPVSALLVFAFSFGVNQVAYRDWTDYFTYDEARTYLQDYNNFPDYDENEDFLSALGYSKEAYYTLSHYDYALLENFSTEDIIAIAEYAKSLEQPVSLKKVKNTVRNMLNYYLVNQVSDLTPLKFASYALPLLSLIWSLIVSIRDRRFHIVTTILLFCGAGVLWFYIAYQGRYPARVDATLRIILVSVALAAIPLTDIGQHNNCTVDSTGKGHSWMANMLIFLSIILALLGYEWAFSQKNGINYNPIPYVEYLQNNTDNIYIRDTSTAIGSASRLSEYPKMEPTVFATGSWASYSPLYEQKLENASIENLSIDTLLQENVYFIVGKNCDLKKTLGLSQDSSVAYDIVETFEDICIIKFTDIAS